MSPTRGKKYFRKLDHSFVKKAMAEVTNFALADTVMNRSLNSKHPQDTRDDIDISHDDNPI